MWGRHERAFGFVVGMEFCASAGTSEAWLWNGLSSLWAEVYGEMIKLFGEKAQTRWSPEKPESRGPSSGVKASQGPSAGRGRPKALQQGPRCKGSQEKALQQGPPRDHQRPEF